MQRSSALCSVLQRKSILGPILFLLHVNYLHLALKVLNPITYTGDRNTFFSYSSINVLFEKTNEDITNYITNTTNITNWLNANKLWLNVKNIKYSFFQKT